MRCELMRRHQLSDTRSTLIPLALLSRKQAAASASGVSASLRMRMSENENCLRLYCCSFAVTFR